MNTRCGLNYFLISTGLDPAPPSKLDPCPCANVGKVDSKRVFVLVSNYCDFDQCRVLKLVWIILDLVEGHV